MKNLKLICALLICALSFNLSFAQTTKSTKKAAKAAEVKRIITASNYIFKATYVVPSTSLISPRALTTDYDVTVADGKLAVYLPYFGRAYSAPYGSTEGGLKLNTDKFDQTATPNAKGGWEITIKPGENTSNGVKDVQQMKLSVSADGYASLYVQSLNKQPITFNGYIEEAKKI